MFISFNYNIKFEKQVGQPFSMNNLDRYKWKCVALKNERKFFEIVNLRLHIDLWQTCKFGISKQDVPVV